MTSTRSSTHPSPNASRGTLRRLGRAACPDDQLTRFEYEGWKLGEWLGSSVASFLRSDSHGMDPEVIEARRRYLTSGVVVVALLPIVRHGAVVLKNGIKRPIAAGLSCPPMFWSTHRFRLNDRS